MIAKSNAVIDVSIHAPVWGANVTNKTPIAVIGVSIHAPVWGANDWCIGCRLHRTFQSTHPCGVRSLGI